MQGRTKQKNTPRAKAQARAIEEARGKIVLRRGTREAIQRRRDHVWKFFLEGTPQTVMAELLYVSTRTITNDLTYMRELHGSKLQEIKGNPAKIHQEIAGTVGRLRYIADKALYEYDTGDSGASRDRSLNTAIRAEWVRTRIEMETGIIPKAGDDIRIQNDHRVTFASRLGDGNSHLQKIFADPARARKVLDAFESMTKSALDGDVIEHKALPAPVDTE